MSDGINWTRINQIARELMYAASPKAVALARRLVEENDPDLGLILDECLNRGAALDEPIIEILKEVRK